MKEPLDKETVSMIWDYHRFQSDMNIRHCGTVKMKNGTEMHLMRFQDSSGKRMSSLDMICHGFDGDYVTEMISRDREHEKEMIVEEKEMFI